MLTSKRATVPIILALFLSASLVLVGISWATLASAGRVTLPWSTPPEFRVVYLVGETPLTGARAKAPTLLGEALGAETVGTWQAVLNSNNAKKIDGIVIDKSAVPFLDRQVLREMYNSGSVVATFDVPAAQLADLLDDPCVTADNFGSEPYSGSSFFVSVSYAIEGSPEDIALIRSSKLCDGMVEGVKGAASGTRTWQTDNLLTDNDYNVFARVLVAQMQNMRPQ